jgi:ketosteroid isomerase-like protein
MSKRNVELMRRVYEVFNARDVEAMIALDDPSIEFHSVFATVFGGVYQGHDGMRMFFRDLADAWDELRAEPEAYFGLGEHTLTFILFHGRGRHSDADVATPIAQVARWRQGLIVYLKSYTSREDALRDLGVSEDELEPIEP